MAPEQFRGEPLTPRTDLWSVGVILFALIMTATLIQRRLFGRPPEW